MQRRAMLAAGTAAITGAVAGSGLGRVRTATAAEGRTPIPNIAVVDQDGGVFRFYDDLIKGRVAMINFFFTSCGETCPLVTENLRVVQDLLADRMGRDIFMYSISLQPEVETPPILKAYADQWAVRPGWRFLTGRPADIEYLRKAIGFASADPDYDKVKDNHTGILRYGNDRVARWTGTPGLGRPEWIARALIEVADIA